MAKRLLIVDDAMFMRMIIRDVATEAGWEIAGEAANGNEAIELFGRTNPDLVTLDLVMPEKGGVETLIELLRIDPSAKVVVVSAVDQKDTLTETVRRGAMDFIVKPFGKDRILGVLARAAN